MWVSERVLFFPELISVIYYFIIEAAKLKWNPFTHFLPIHIGATFPTLISTLVFSQHDESAGQKAAWPIEKTPVSCST